MDEITAISIYGRAVVVAGKSSLILLPRRHIKDSSLQVYSEHLGEVGFTKSRLRSMGRIIDLGTLSSIIAE